MYFGHVISLVLAMISHMSILLPQENPYTVCSGMQMYPAQGWSSTPHSVVPTSLKRFVFTHYSTLIESYNCNVQVHLPYIMVYLEIYFIPTWKCIYKFAHFPSTSAASTVWNTPSYLLFLTCQVYVSIWSISICNCCQDNLLVNLLICASWYLGVFLLTWCSASCIHTTEYSSTALVAWSTICACIVRCWHWIHVISYYSKSYCDERTLISNQQWFWDRRTEYNVTPSRIRSHSIKSGVYWTSWYVDLAGVKQDYLNCYILLYY